jgi:hypothetical protein
MLSQVSVEHDNNYWVNCVKSQDCRRTLAGEARTKAGNDTYFISKCVLLQHNEEYFVSIFNETDEIID